MENQRLQQLINKVLSGRASAQEQQELDDWYAAQETGKGLTSDLDEEHKSAMGEQLFESIHQRLRPEQTSSMINYRTWMIAAAVFLVLASAALYFFVNRRAYAPPVMASIWKEERSVNEIKSIRLPDGSAVWLNAGSAIRYDSNFMSGKREVWVQGEAFFDVVHTEGKPFEVHTGSITTRVLGTAFNIDAYSPEEAIAITVKRGKVTVADSVHNSGVLLPGQRLLYKADGTFEKDSAIAGDITAWTTGQLVFRDMPFRAVAKRLEKKFGIQLTFKDATIGNCRITASFHQNTPLRDMLDMLALANGSTIEPARHTNTYSISGKKRCK
ncbi:FecR family protein [Longitalea arenae]|uniref:FecR family protein n=1 Tax=Longitalea arenae TaxID=2812558 RepID=UPI001967157B|nr:FecR domain-containing protein [Longitalea arenae]